MSSGFGINKIKREIGAAPLNAAYHNCLGNVLRDQGDVEGAVRSFREALRLKPDDAGAMNNLGLALQVLGRHASAEECFRKALCHRPDYAEVYNNLGILCGKTGRLYDARTLLEKALSLHAEYAGAHNNLGNVLKALGQLDAAAAHYQNAVRIDPRMFEAYANLGDVMRQNGRGREAMECLQKALAANPDNPCALNSLGLLYQQLGQLEKAESCFVKLIDVMPENSGALNNMGTVLKDAGCIDEALTCFKRACAANPEYDDAYSNYLLTLHYHVRYSPEDLFKEHVRCAKHFTADSIDDFYKYTNSLDTGRKLKVGYVSPDFVFHPVSFFVGAVLKHHDQNMFEIFCYADIQKDDLQTCALRRNVRNWRSIFGLHDNDVAQMIQGDGIDILVDLAGHCGKNRMGLFARKSAPLQVTWIGYPDTTGLETMDYRITDEIADPPGAADELHTEKLIRLEDGFLCYDPHPESPEIGSLPFLYNKVITFGSFNNIAKVNREVAEQWCRVLNRVPGSRLIIKSGLMNDAKTRARYLDMFLEMGISEDRLHFWTQKKTIPEHLAQYNAIDIALDPFPYNGTTTSCEALWMGVPVITLNGNRHSARVGASLLSAVGLSDLIALTNDEYVEKAVQLAGDIERLKYLRQTLRKTMAASPLCDAERFTCNLESAYRDMWEKWVEEQQTAGMDDVVRRSSLAVRENTVDKRMSNNGIADDPQQTSDEDLQLTTNAHPSTSMQQPESIHERRATNDERRTTHLNLNKLMAARHMQDRIRQASDAQQRRLHIGGCVRHPDWEICNINPGEYVDHVGNAADLSRFNDETFAELYSSHVLEHFRFQSELAPVLREWYRVLRPGGTLYVSVPDLDKLCRLFVSGKLNGRERFHVMRMVFGGHVDEHDVHRVGFDAEIMERFLRDAGFVSLQTVEQFDIFNDTSKLVFKEVPISLNMIARKPGGGGLQLDSAIVRDAVMHDVVGRAEP